MKVNENCSNFGTWYKVANMKWNGAMKVVSRFFGKAVPQRCRGAAVPFEVLEDRPLFIIIHQPRICCQKDGPIPSTWHSCSRFSDHLRCGGRNMFCFLLIKTSRTLTVIWTIEVIALYLHLKVVKQLVCVSYKTNIK